MTHLVTFSDEAIRRGNVIDAGHLWMDYAAERASVFLRGRRFLICDGDMNFRYRFKIVMEAAGMKFVKKPYRAPNANACAERFVRSIREECLSRMILFGDSHLRRVVDEYLLHFNHERNHQGIGNELMDGDAVMGTGPARCCRRLGGLLKFFHEKARPRQRSVTGFLEPPHDPA